MANDLLRGMYARFEECLDAKSICGKLFSKHLISLPIKEKIAEATTKDGNGVLLDHLYKRGTATTIETFAAILSNETDSPKVQQLGNDLWGKLHQLHDSSLDTIMDESQDLEESEEVDDTPADSEQHSSTSNSEVESTDEESDTGSEKDEITDTTDSDYAPEVDAPDVVDQVAAMLAKRRAKDSSVKTQQIKRPRKEESESDDETYDEDSEDHDVDKSIQKTTVRAKGVPAAKKWKRKKHKTAKTWVDEAKKVLSDLHSLPFAEPFVEPVDLKEYPEYTSYVKHPLCLNDMEEKLQNGEYQTGRAFFEDFKQIVDNSRNFNRVAVSEIVKCTDKLKDYIHKRKKLFWKAVAHHPRQLRSFKDEPLEHQDKLQRALDSRTKVDSRDMEQALTDERSHELLLQELCYMASGIEQFFIGPNGGTFILGNGDASLEVPAGAVKKETLVRYAIILHGPFVFPTGSKLSSVVIYLNMDGATLVKPVFLALSHWCSRTEGGAKDTLNFLQAPHALEAGQQKYIFEKREKGDFASCSHRGVLSISKPQCLHCVEAEIDSVARYSAITFSQYLPSDDTLFYRIQFMCDSQEWNEKLRSTLQQKNWKMITHDDVMTRFQYATDQHQISVSPEQMSGPGWEAAIDGQQAVIDHDFLVPVRKSKSDLEAEVTRGHFPPCILYKFIYTGAAQNRVNAALMKVHVHGGNVPLTFCCKVKEEIPAFPTASPTSVEVVPSIGPPQTAPVPDILLALGHLLDAKWQHFGTFLGVDYPTITAIEKDKGGKPEDCMLELLGKWTSNQEGTGTYPRTWQTVVKAVKYTGNGVLAEKLAIEHKVNLSQ